MRHLNRHPYRILGALLALGCALAHARVVTVTTTENLNPPAGQKSLLQALSELQDGDEIKFNLPGAGPHFIATPPGGYPLITQANVSIDGYSQPGAAPNTNPILAPNNARIRIVLDSTSGNNRLLDFAGDSPNDDTGYGNGEGAVLGVLGARGFVLRGVSILAVPLAGEFGDVVLYAVAFAKGASGRVSGCWIGLHPDGQTIAGPAGGVAGFRYLARDGNNTTLDTILVNEVVLGVGKAPVSAPADFNVLVGITRAPLVIEGNDTRIAGNFFGVLPDGVHDVNPMFDPALAGGFQGFIGIGHAGNNTLIGTDGDGVNDANERNIFGGTLPPDLGGYDHSLEFYSPSPGTNIVIAGNLIGVGIDGQTRFTNAVPALNAAGAAAVFRFGSNLDGVSDALEGNLVFNQWPETLFGADYLLPVLPASLNFFDELATGGFVSARGNRFVNNLAFPASPLRDGGFFLGNYYAKALADPAQGVVPTLTAGSTASRLKGTVPLADAPNFPETHVDVYLADPAGIALGKALSIPELPEGFVQGGAFLGSFQDNGPDDQDPAAGVFDLNVASLGLVEGLVTVTANFASGPVGEAGTIVLTSPFSPPLQVSGGGAGELKFTAISKVAGGIRLEWTGGGELQAVDRLGGAWQTVAGAASPHTTPAAGGPRYFRLQR